MEERKKIFMAYSDHEEDLKIYRMLDKHFQILVRAGIIEVIDKAAVFEQTNDASFFQNIAMQCDVIVPMLSIDYFNDDRSFNLLTKLLDTDKKIIPLLARDCDYHNIPALKNMANMVLPDKEKSIKHLTGLSPDKDTVLKEIARKIQQALLPGIADLKVPENKNFLYMSIISLSFGIMSSVFIWHETGNIGLSTMIALLFLTITSIAFSKYRAVKAI